jgi:hypothetical protein
MYEVHLEPGVLLPAGNYEGTIKETSFEDGEGQTKWTDPHYMIELGADELESMGRKFTSEISVEYDVSKFVRGGDILV